MGKGCVTLGRTRNSTNIRRQTLRRTKQRVEGLVYFPKRVTKKGVSSGKRRARRGKGGRGGRRRPRQQQQEQEQQPPEQQQGQQEMTIEYMSLANAEGNEEEVTDNNIQYMDWIHPEDHYIDDIDAESGSFTSIQYPIDEKMNILSGRDSWTMAQSIVGNSPVETSHKNVNRSCEDDLEPYQILEVQLHNGFERNNQEQHREQQQQQQQQHKEPRTFPEARITMNGGGRRKRNITPITLDEKISSTISNDNTTTTNQTIAPNKESSWTSICINGRSTCEQQSIIPMPTTHTHTHGRAEVIEIMDHGIEVDANKNSRNNVSREKTAGNQNLKSTVVGPMSNSCSSSTNSAKENRTESLNPPPPPPPPSLNGNSNSNAKRIPIRTSITTTSRHKAIGLYLNDILERLRPKAAAKLELIVQKAIIDAQIEELDECH